MAQWLADLPSRAKKCRTSTDNSGAGGKHWNFLISVRIFSRWPRCRNPGVGDTPNGQSTLLGRDVAITGPSKVGGLPRFLAASGLPGVICCVIAHIHSLTTELEQRTPTCGRSRHVKLSNPRQQARVKQQWFWYATECCLFC